MPKSSCKQAIVFTKFAKYAFQNVFVVIIFLSIEISSKMMKNLPYINENGKRKVQGVPQSQTAALNRHKEEGEADKI